MIAQIDLHFSPSPLAFLGFAAVLLVCFFVGIKKKPAPYEDGKWVWWTTMSVFAIVIVYLVLRGFEIDPLANF